MSTDNLDTITSRIHKQSDDALKAEISQQLDVLFDGFGDMYSGVATDLKYAEIEGINDKVWWMALHRALARMLFNARKDARRSKAITEFLTKVNNLTKEVDGLKNQLGE